MMRARIAALALGAVWLAATHGLAQDAAGDEAEVLALNEAFYEAFRTGDLDKMESLWGQREPIAMGHPRGEHFEGREAVMDYWRWALPGSSPEIDCLVTGTLRQGNLFTVYCDELLFQGSLEMKNVFRKEGGAWKMIYHGPPEQQSVS